MRAVVVSSPGGPEVLELTEVPDPVPLEDEVLVRVKAIGLNHADTFMRSGQWPSTPVLGIECAGEVVLDRTGSHAPGSKVVAIVGGLARERNGTYAELITVPATNAIPVETELSWSELAAIPETYATAWTALHDNLQLADGQVLLVRGATSALGQAVVDLAVDAGATVLATTRREERRPLLHALGADETFIDDGGIAEQVRRLYPDGVDCVLDLVGNSALADSLQAVRPRGRVCQVGFLGGLEPTEFNLLTDLRSGVQLSFFASAFAFGTEAYPFSAVPFQAIVEKVEDGTLNGKPKRVFRVDEIAEAHRLLDAGEAAGKLVVTLE